MGKHSNSNKHDSSVRNNSRLSEKEKEENYNKSVNILGYMYNQEKRDIERFAAFSKTLKGAE